MIKVLTIQSDKREQMIDISPMIVKEAENIGFKDGIVVVYVPHTTAAVTINENADPDVKHDILTHLKKIIPYRAPGFRHMEGNSDGHIKSTLTGVSEIVIFENGKPLLGTWQDVFFCEFDGPRTRKVYLKFIKG
jgi:secondary thiamine-phosphate synthase enzyme